MSSPNLHSASTFEAHSELIADFTGNVVNRLLYNLVPAVWPNVFLLAFVPNDSNADEISRHDHDCLLYELSCESLPVNGPNSIAPFESFNTTKKVATRKSSGEITTERIKKTCKDYFDEHDTYKSGYELFVSRRCILYDINFFLILVVPLGSEGFDPSLLDKPVNNGIYEGIVNVISEKINECPIFKPSFTGGSIQEELNRALVWFCNPFEIENLMRESLAYVLGLTFFYYYPEIEQKIGKDNLTTVGKMIFSMLHSISITYVEKEDCIGHLVFVNREDAKVNIPLKNLDRDYRLTRKLLSLSSKHNSLLCDHDGPYGLGEPKSGMEPIFTVSFTSHGNWEIQREGKSLACVQSGNVSFHRSFIATSIYKQTRKLFAQVFETGNVQLAVSILNRVIAREKGTILVFHRNAKEEATRPAVPA